MRIQIKLSWLSARIIIGGKKYNFFFNYIYEVNLLYNKLNIKFTSDGGKFFLY